MLTVNINGDCCSSFERDLRYPGKISSDNHCLLLDFTLKPLPPCALVMQNMHKLTVVGIRALFDLRQEWLACQRGRSRNQTNKCSLSGP